MKTLAFLSCAVIGTVAGAAEVPPVLRACGDRAEFPPYTQFVRQHGKKVEQAGGYSVDLLVALFKAENREVEVELIPWTRCVQLAEAGQYDLVLDIAPKEERKRAFLLPQPHYTMTPVVVYRRAKPPVLQTRDDLAALRRCEVKNWDYSISGTRKSPDKVLRYSTVETAIGMLRAGRCDVMQCDEEIVRGVASTLPGGWPTELATMPLPWMPATSHYVGVSRQLPYADALLLMVDKGIERMKKSGEAAQLMARYGGK